MTITLAELRKTVREQIHAGGAEYSDESIDIQINAAIDFARAENLYVPVTDETLEEASETYEYPLTGGVLDDLVFITAIYEETDESDVWQNVALSRNYWTIEEGSIPYLLLRSEAFFPIAGKGLRIKGLMAQPRVSANADVVYLSAAYVTWKAAAFCHGFLSGSVAQHLARWHESRVGVAEQYAEIARNNMDENKIPAWARRIKGRL